MSAAKGCRKAQLARLARLDANFHWLYAEASTRRDRLRSMRLWFGGVVALGDALQKKTPGAWASLSRHPIGTAILLHNFNKLIQIERLSQGPVSVQ